MNSPVTNVYGAMQEALGRASGTLLVRDTDFGDTLRIGQIIKGRVMRHYDGGRYLVDFGGQQKVVDSSVPLRSSEMFDSRVVALGDKVHLQRLVAASDAATQMAAASTPAVGGRAGQLLSALLAQFNANLPPADLSLAVRAVRQSANPQLMAQSVLLLHKLGLPMAPELLQALSARLGASVQRPAAEIPRGATTVPGDRAVGASQASVEALATLLAGAFAQSQAAIAPPAAGAQVSAHADGGDAVPANAAGQSPQGGSGGQGDRERRRDWELGQWLLGVQSHPRVAHRLLNLPIWFGDRLVEVSLALYSEHGREEDDDALSFRRIVFFVTTEQLGKVQVTVHAAERRLRLDIATDSDAATQSLSRYAGELRATLVALGWEVDDVRYLEADLDDEGGVLGSVVHHHISKDSLSRLM